MRCVKCDRTCQNPDTSNWLEFQMCYGCARDEHPEFYAGKPKHGVGGKYLAPAIYKEFLVPTIEG